MDFDTVLSICLGLGLSAACGFRVFVPLLVMSLATHAGWLELAGGFSWIGETPALVTFAVATGLEIGAYYIPWLDNVLDSVATPAAVVAGTVATASVVTGLDPALKWILAAIAGGGVAGAVQTATVGGRMVSSLATAGLGNPLLSTLEWLGSLLLSLMSILLPVLAACLVLIWLILVWRRRRRAAAAT